MNTFPKNYENSALAWCFIKGSFLFFWISNMLIMLSDLTPVCFLPVGTCNLFCISSLFTPTGKILLSVVIVISSIVYLLEKQMLLVTLIQFLLSCIIISHHESNGMFHHATIFSPIFAVQTLAYWQYHRNKNFDISYYRIQYSIQMIAAAYTLAGIAKVSSSGMEWINSHHFFPLQVIKNFSFTYFGSGRYEALIQGNQIANYLQGHPMFINILLSVSLFLELFCFLALLSTKTRVVFGIGLLLMHTGIYFIMDIPFGVIAPIMLIFFLNPLYLIYKQLINFIFIIKRKSDRI